MTLVEHAGRPTAALLHDPMLVDEPELIEATAAAAGLWLDNERLQAKLRPDRVPRGDRERLAVAPLLAGPRGRIVNLNHASRVASGYLDEEEVRWLPFWDVFVSPEERGLANPVRRGGAVPPRSGLQLTFVGSAPVRC